MEPCNERRPRDEAVSFERSGGGFPVHYVEHHPSREGSPTDTSTLPQIALTANRLVLSAGTLGTPYLLLRNQGMFSGLSKMLGTRFCGDGDLLTFLIKATRQEGDQRVPRMVTDFAHQLTTFRAHGGSFADRARAVEEFGRLFLGKLWRIYGAHLPSGSPD